MAKKFKEQEGRKRNRYYFLIDKGFVEVLAFNEEFAKAIAVDKFDPTTPIEIDRLGELIQDSDTNYRVNLK